MITLNQIADLFISDFSGGVPSKDSNLDRREIILKARAMINPLIKTEQLSMYNEGSKGAITSCIASYDVDLEEDDTKQKFITIPDFYLTLPFNKGVHRAYIKGNPYNDFVIQQNPGISGGLLQTKIKGIQFCYIEGQKVKMSQQCLAKKADKIVLQLIVPIPDTAGPNDPLPILSEHMSTILLSLKQEYAPTANVPADMANNQNKDIK